jgi:methionine synthase II (cobalamin-independent)
VCVDPNACFIFGTDEEGLKEIIEKLIRINNLAIEDKPEDLIITTHICRGNFHSTWACQGGYDRVAKDIFAKENVNAFYLEFDDERSGDFKPLQYISEDKKVVLGLITTKSPTLEDKNYIITRIHEAEKYIPLERLCLSPQCGFASTEEGNKLTEEEQWAKLRLVQEIVKEVWK